MNPGCGTSRTCVLRAALLLTLLPSLLVAKPFKARRTLEPHPVFGWLADRVRATILERIELSEEQLDRIRLVLNGHRRRLLDESHDLETARIAVMDRVRSDDFDAEALRRSHAAASAAELELALDTAEVLREIKSVLTPQQRAAASAVFDELAEGAEQRFSGPRERPDVGELATPPS